jgi:hypothetical protein
VWLQTHGDEPLLRLHARQFFRFMILPARRRRGSRRPLALFSSEWPAHALISAIRQKALIAFEPTHG